MGRSQDIFEKSLKVFPGGVNSPVRSFRSVGGTPLVFSHGQGKYLFDVDGRQYTDYCSSWGPLILGYSHPEVVAAVKEQASRAFSFGAPSEEELLLALQVQSFAPFLEKMRFVSSGTEAVMSALRLARGFTKKNKVIKFIGCYHGHSNELLVQAGSGLATLGQPDSAGVTPGSVQDTLCLPYNDFEAVEAAFQKHPRDIACVIIEPLAANMGLVKAKDNFLSFLRSITQKYQSLLIFDEVMTGFRLGEQGATGFYGKEADIWTYGKIVGGGLPAAMYGSRNEIMQCVSPLGPVYQAGTLSGCPMAMVSGRKTLEIIRREGVYEILEKKGQELDEAVQKNLSSHMKDSQLFYVREGSFFAFFFGCSKAPENFAEVQKTRMDIFNKVYHHLLQKGIYLGPSGYETGFLNIHHTQEDFEHLTQSIAEVL